MPYPFVRSGLALFAWLALGCSPPAEPPAEPAASEADAEAAEVAGETITVTEVDEWIKDALLQQATRNGDPSRLHEVRSAALEQIIQNRLLDAEAQVRGTDPGTLLEEEVQRRIDVDDAAVEQYYEQQRERFEGSSFEEAAPRIRQLLEGQRRQAATREFVASLREAAGVEVRLEPPRIEVSAEGPARGPVDAPITIVEFSDYQCPFCRRAEPTVKQLLERYPDRLRFVYRHFPLDAIHPRARPAAEAAACADEQDQFWSYHDALFQDTSGLSDEGLRRHASDLGLDVDAFGACLEEGRFRSTVDADLAAGKAAGVSGTPAFFVNGIPLSGARPLADFVAIIERELERSSEGS